ncbi:MAG: hypothetical protein ACT4OV_12595 [Microthrixaceae bacterium]
MMRRTIGITASAAAISIAAILPAGAQTSPGGLDSYAAGAAATALDLSVFGQQVTLSATSAGIDSTAQAVADATALLTPGFESDDASVVSTGAKVAKDPCTTIDLPSPINAAGLDIVCVRTSAEVLNGNPASSALSDEVVIEIKAPDLIADTPLAEVVAGVQDGLGQLFDAIVEATGPIEEATQVQLTDIIDGLLSEVQEGDVLARITVAPTSSTGAFGVGVAANAVSNGVVVELLPNLPGGALAVATVGSSTAGVVRDATDGTPTLSGSAAVLDVAYPNGLLGGLAVLTDALGDAVNVTSEQLACGPDNPLSDVICFTLGSSHPLDAAQAKALGFDYGANTVGQESSVLGLTLLAAAPDGGIVLNVGHTIAASGSTLPLPGGCTENCSPPPLPRTGGETPMALTLALLAVGAAGALVLRRSRTA